MKGTGSAHVGKGLSYPENNGWPNTHAHTYQKRQRGSVVKKKYMKLRTCMGEGGSMGTWRLVLGIDLSKHCVYICKLLKQ